MAAIFGYIGKVSRVNNLIYSGAAETRVVKTFTYESDSESSSLQISNLSEKNVTYNYSNPAELVFTPEDYGYVSDVHSEQENYGEILLPISQGTSDYNLISSPTASIPFGSISVSGSASYQPNYRNYINGSASYSVSYNPPENTSTLFTFGQKQTESVIYDYSELSVNIITTEDYGLTLDSHTDSDDFNLISDSVLNVREDWGEVRYVGDIIPFGLFSIGGSASYQPNYRNYINGSGDTKLVKSSIGNGTLFSLDESSSSITYVYTLEGSTIPSIIDDYGSVSGPIDGGYADNGNISDIIDGYDDYLLITDPLVSVVPFGIIGPLTGSAGIVTRSVTSFFPTETAIEKVVWSPDDLGGSLYGFGNAAESRLYNYDETDIVDLLDNYGLVSDSSIIGFEDYAFISGIPNSADIYGFITDSVVGLSTSYPLSVETSITLSGIVIEKVVYDEIGSGYIPLISGAAESATFREIENAEIYDGGVRTITLTGSGVIRSQFEYVGSGNIPLLSGAAESITKSYNESSAVILESVDYGLVSGSIDTYLDWGLITDIVDGIDDYELLTEVTSRIPFGSIEISGSAQTLVFFLPYKFTGITSAIEKVTWSPDDLGGSLYGFGNAAESRLYNYDDTDIVYFEQPDYGSVGIAATYFEDWGYVNAIPDGTDDYLYLTGDPIWGIGDRFPLTQGTAITLSGTALESTVPATEIGSGLITLSGTALESFSANTPEDTQLFVISGTLVEKNTESYVGFGTIFMDAVGVTTASLIARTRSYVGLGTLILSGTALESFSAQTPEDTQLFTISGTALESESESYVGLGTLILSDTLVEKNTESYVGLGTLTLSGTALESFSAQTPEDTQLFTISGIVTERTTRFIPITGVSTNSNGPSSGGIGGTISIFNTVTRYYSPVYPRNALIGDPGSGIGTIRLNDDNGLTITRAILPYFAKGGITISGSLNESFTPATHVGVGIVTISGVAGTRPVQVYGYYGDDRDPGTSGNITISQQSTLTIEKNTESYVGLGTITISETFDPRLTNAYESSGQITISGSANDAVVIPVSNTVLFQISGPKFSQESYIRTGYIGSGIITISGQVSNVQRTFGYEGSGTVTLSGNSVIRPAIKHIATGGFRFVSKYNVDNDYDTCDSDSITVDRISDADVSFIANPPETTILFNIGGNSDTRVETDHLYVGSGFPTIYGGYSELKFVSAYSGIGSITLTSIAEEKEADVYVGLGTILSISGSSEVLSSQTPEDTILLQIGGSASTKVESDYRYIGLGTEYLYGSASTRQIDVYTGVGSGVITLSGELIDPNVKFVPSPDGFGTISVLGSSDEKFTRVVPSTGGTLFTLSGGFESFSETTYVGLGTIYLVDASTSIINNPYQPPRVYVTII